MGVLELTLTQQLKTNTDHKNKIENKVHNTEIK